MGAGALAGLTVPAATPAPPPLAPAVTTHTATTAGAAGRTLLANDAASLFRGADMQPEQPTVEQVPIENRHGNGTPAILWPDRQCGGTAGPW